MINYKHSLITYYDILGFKNIVNNKSADEIYSILNLFNKSSETLTEEYNLEFTLTAFSDTIIRSYSGNKTDLFSVLLDEIIATSYIIYDLLFSDIVIRGSLSIGDIFIEKNIFYGPGIIQAYDLENKAIYPRIIIDKELVEELLLIVRYVDYKTSINEVFSYPENFDRHIQTDKLNNESIQQIENDLKKMGFTTYSDLENIRSISTKIRKILNYINTIDGKEYFLDYLVVLDDDFENHDAFMELLIKHYEFIQNNLNKYSKEQNVLSKYIWMKEYHNNAIDKLIEAHYESTSYWAYYFR